MCKEYRELLKTYFRDSSLTFSKLLKSPHQDKTVPFVGYYILPVPYIRDLHYCLKIFGIKKCKKLRHNNNGIHIYLLSKILNI